MKWAIDCTENYPNISNFQPYNLLMCALFDSYVPDKINYYTHDEKNSQHNAELATCVMKELGIPVFLDSNDLQETTVNEKVLLTQLSTDKVVLEILPPPPPATSVIHIEESNTQSVSTRNIQIVSTTRKINKMLNMMK